MIVVRRVYILAVCAISLQSVVWAIIALLRNLLLSELNAPKSSIALQTAVIIVGLPIFLVHWLWAQRLAAGSAEERMAALRRIYLVGVMAAFVAPFAASAFSLLHAIFRQLLGVETPSYVYYPVKSLASNAVYYGVSLLVLALFWFYQRHVLRQDMAGQPGGETAVQALIQRISIYAFAAAGLIMTVAGALPLLRWLLFQFGDVPARYWMSNTFLAAEWTRLLVGVALWLVHWLWAQRLFAAGPVWERRSALRKLYLYAAIFVGTVATVASASAIFAGILSRLFNASLGGDVRETLSVLLVAGLVWAYHAVVLQSDARQSEERPQQAAIRRLYRYLVAGVGLVALLVGVGGIISILFFTLDGEPFIGGVRQALAWFISAIVAGLLVWLLPWRQIQEGAAAEGALGQAERQSLVRKIYLYVFIFVATMTVLGTAVYIVSQLVELLIGSRTSAHLLRDLGMALAYSLMAVGIWLYHGRMLRSDNRLADQEQRAGLAGLQVVIVGGDQPDLMARLWEGLQQKLPEVQWTAPLLGVSGEETAVLAQANVIISPATLALHNGQAELATAVANSPAYKLLIPTRQPDCLWLGLEPEDEATLAKKTALAIEQIAAGEAVRPGRGLGLGTILGLIIGGFVLFVFLFSLVMSLIDSLLFR
jgi:hypothetical protein